MRPKKIIGASVMVMAVDALIFLQASAPVFSGWKEVRVQPNQTIWTLGQHYDPSADPRDVEAAIMQRNHVQETIQPGEVLQIPTKTMSMWRRLGL